MTKGRKRARNATVAVLLASAIVWPYFWVEGNYALFGVSYAVFFGCIVSLQIIYKR